MDPIGLGAAVDDVAGTAAANEVRVLAAVQINHVRRIDEVKRIGARPAVDLVEPRVGDDVDVSVVRLDDVVARAAVDLVVAHAAPDVVVAAKTFDEVAGSSAVQIVVEVVGRCPRGT